MPPCETTKDGILLVHTRRAAPGRTSSPTECTGVFLLAAVLEQHGYRARVFHGPAHEFPAVMEKLPQELRSLAVGFFCDFENRTTVEGLSRMVKKRYRLPVIVGGPQSIALGEDFFRKSRCDFVVRGEAEHTLPELLRAVSHGKPALSGIPGIAYRCGKKMLTNPDRPPVEDLDALPFPAYHLSLNPEMALGRTILTGRGCPFSCAFCFNTVSGRKVRYRSLHKVIGEMEENFRRYPQRKYIHIMDDTFTLDASRVKDFCRELARLRREYDFVWYCEGHVRPLAKNPGMLSEMAQAGLARLQIGVESLDQDVLDLYDKHSTLEEIESVVGEAVQAGIPQIATNLIVGGPLETPERFRTVLRRIERLIDLAPGVIDINTGFLRPYPGTAITRNPKRFGLQILDPEGAGAFDDFPLVVPEGQTAEDVLSRRFHLALHIKEVMAAAMDSGRIPHRRILDSYRLSLGYGVTNLWKAILYAENPPLNEYYRLLSKGEARRLQDIAPEKIGDFRPLRTIELRKNLTFVGGVPRWNDMAFTPLEWEILLQSSGKRRFGDIVAELQERRSTELFSEGAAWPSALSVLQRLDTAYLLVFSEY